MSVLWIFVACIGLILFVKLARIVAAVLVAIIAAGGALLITAVIGAALNLEPSRDTGALVGLFVVSLAAIWALCRRMVRRQSMVASGQATTAVQSPSPRVVIDGDRATILKNSAADDAADLRRLGKARQGGLWPGKAGRAGAADRRLDMAWSIIEARGGEHRARIAVAKQSCTRLLALEQGGLHAGSALDALTMVRKGVPELVETWLAHAVTADAGARRQAFAEMVASIERVAARAERDTDALVRSHATAFAFQRDHLDRRSGEDRL